MALTCGADHRLLWSAQPAASMHFYRRRLPHWIPDQALVFVTWRLAGSAPPPKPAILTIYNTGRLPEHPVKERPSGPRWLQDPRVADVVVEALQYGEKIRHLYQLYAWTIMPNHVHVILEPRVALAEIMRWLKGRTSRVANRILGRTGMPFWQDESYDHWVRSSAELEGLIAYVESNPVKAGLVGTEQEWRWSSAGFRADDKKRSSAPRCCPEM